MQKCDICKHETTSLFITEGINVWACRECYQRPPSRIQANGKHYWPDGSGSITAAHLDDIEHRVLLPDQTVIRDTKKTFI